MRRGPRADRRHRRQARPRPQPGDDPDEDDRPRKRRPRAQDEDEDDDRPRRRAARPGGGDDLGASPLAAVVPVGVSPWALLACYLGLIGCIPLLGAPFAFFGLLFGIIALVRRPKSTNYGSITGNVRAFIGIICGVIGLAMSAIIGIAMLSNTRW